MPSAYIPCSDGVLKHRQYFRIEGLCMVVEVGTNSNHPFTEVSIVAELGGFVGILGLTQPSSKRLDQ